MSRDFFEVCEQIKKVAPKVLVDELESSVGCWAPETVWDKLSMYIHRYVSPCSTDQTSVAVYAIFCDCSESEMKKRFEADGL